MPEFLASVLHLSPPMDTRRSLALLLSATKNVPQEPTPETVRFAEEILIYFGGAGPLLAADPREWSRFPSLQSSQLELLGCVARLARGQVEDLQPGCVLSSGAAFCWFRSLGSEPQEVVAALLVSAGGRVLGRREIFRGTSQASLARPKEILREALFAGADGVLVAHNHPSGRLVPSDDDMRFTSVLKAACDALGIELHDHLIVGRDGYFSFADARLLPGNILRKGNPVAAEDAVSRKV